MNRASVVGVALVAALWIPAAVSAHTGHTHKVMGTISAVQETRLEVKTTDGKVVAITLNDKTVYRQGKAKADETILKVGERVVVEGLQPDGAKTLTAKTVRMAAAPGTAEKATAKK